MARTRTLTWREIDHPSVIALFDVWVDGAERAWLKRAWRHLRAAGVLTYTTNSERCRVAASVLVLERMYRGFCARAFDEDWEPDYADAAECLGVTPATLALIPEVADPYRTSAWDEVRDDLGSDFTEALAFRMDEVAADVVRRIQDEIARDLEGVLADLEKQRRPAVLVALAEGAGVNRLFVELIRTANSASGDDAAVLNSDHPPWADAYGWVKDGCPD